jgi:hypothetical protein
MSHTRTFTFQVLYLAVKDTKTSRFSAVAFQVINWLQMLSFPLAVLLLEDVAPHGMGLNSFSRQTKGLNSFSRSS